MIDVMIIYTREISRRCECGCHTYVLKKGDVMIPISRTKHMKIAMTQLKKKYYVHIICEMLMGGHHHHQQQQRTATNVGAIWFTCLSACLWSAVAIQQSNEKSGREALRTKQPIHDTRIFSVFRVHGVAGDCKPKRSR